MEQRKHIKDTERSNEWSVLRIMSDFVKGFDELRDLGPAVTFLGAHVFMRIIATIKTRIPLHIS